MVKFQKFSFSSDAAKHIQNLGELLYWANLEENNTRENLFASQTNGLYGHAYNAIKDIVKYEANLTDEECDIVNDKWDLGMADYYPELIQDAVNEFRKDLVIEKQKERIDKMIQTIESHGIEVVNSCYVDNWIIADNVQMSADWNEVMGFLGY